MPALSPEDGICLQHAAEVLVWLHIADEEEIVFRQGIEPPHLPLPFLIPAGAAAVRVCRNIVDLHLLPGDVLIVQDFPAGEFRVRKNAVIAMGGIPEEQPGINPLGQGHPILQGEMRHVMDGHDLPPGPQGQKGRIVMGRPEHIATGDAKGNLPLLAQAVHARLHITKKSMCRFALLHEDFIPFPATDKQCKFFPAHMPQKTGNDFPHITADAGMSHKPAIDNDVHK